MEAEAAEAALGVYLVAGAELVAAGDIHAADYDLADGMRRADRLQRGDGASDVRREGRGVRAQCGPGALTDKAGAVVVVHGAVAGVVIGEFRSLGGGKGGVFGFGGKVGVAPLRGLLDGI